MFAQRAAGLCHNFGGDDGHPLVLDSDDGDIQFKYQPAHAYTGGNQQAGPDGINRPRQQGGGPGSNTNDEMLAYLQANTADMKYLLAVPSSQNGATLGDCKQDAPCFTWAASADRMKWSLRKI